MFFCQSKKLLRVEVPAVRCGCPQRINQDRIKLFVRLQQVSTAILNNDVESAVPQHVGKQRHTGQILQHGPVQFDEADAFNARRLEDSLNDRPGPESDDQNPLGGGRI